MVNDLKKFISAIVATIVMLSSAMNVMAGNIAVSNDVLMKPGDSLTTSNSYKAVLVTNKGADLNNLTSENIYYIDQAETDVAAFVNMGLKGGVNLADNTEYTMYLVAEDGTKSESTIKVSSEPQKIEGVEMTALSEEEGGMGAVRPNVDSFDYVYNQGYTVKYTPVDGRAAEKYELVIQTAYKNQTYTYTKVLDMSGAGKMDLALQISNIPCDKNKKPLATFETYLVPYIGPEYID